MIYLASPYSGTPEQMEARYKETLLWCAGAMTVGVPIFSPIVHWHEAAKVHKMPTDAEFWWDYNRQMMCDSDAAVFLLLEGWEQSKGVQMEHAFCETNKLPYLQVHPVGTSPSMEMLKEHWKAIGGALTQISRPGRKPRAVDRN